MDSDIGCKIKIAIGILCIFTSIGLLYKNEVSINVVLKIYFVIIYINNVDFSGIISKLAIDFPVQNLH